MFVENHGLLFRIDIVPYSINQPLKLCLSQILMDGTYTMVQYVGLNVVQYKKCSLSSVKCQSFHFCYKTYIPRVLLVNLLKQTHPSDSFI